MDNMRIVFNFICRHGKETNLHGNRAAATEHQKLQF